MEEGVGFEPTEDGVSALNSFQDCLNNPALTTLHVAEHTGIEPVLLYSRTL